MVRADSHRIPLVPRYSGYHYSNQDFKYRTITFFGWVFQNIFLSFIVALCGPTTPRCMHHGLGSSRFARRYSGNRFLFLFLRVLRCFTSPGSPSFEYYDMTRSGLPHSEISGSKQYSCSPKRIAGKRVLHRLSVPRHPPYALIILPKLLRLSYLFYYASFFMTRLCLYKKHDDLF